MRFHSFPSANPGPPVVMPYSAAQFECICQSLYHTRDGPPLVRIFKEYERLLNTLGPEYWTDTVILAYIFTLYHSNQFDRLFETISRGRFSAKNFKELQEIWFKGRYKENENKRQKVLGAVEKYRLRRKYPPPSSIWDGQETVYSFKENSRRYLKQFYKSNPYPSLEQKREIARLTELEIVQISNWFKNRRQREKCSKVVQKYFQFAKYSARLEREREALLATTTAIYDHAVFI